MYLLLDLLFYQLIYLMMYLLLVWQNVPTSGFWKCTYFWIFKMYLLLLYLILDCNMYLLLMYTILFFQNVPTSDVHNSAPPWVTQKWGARSNHEFWLTNVTWNLGHMVNRCCRTQISCQKWPLRSFRGCVGLGHIGGMGYTKVGSKREVCPFAFREVMGSNPDGFTNFFLHFRTIFIKLLHVKNPIDRGI